MTLLSKVVTILLNFLINDMERLAKYKAQSFIRNNTLQLQLQSSLCLPRLIHYNLEADNTRSNPGSSLSRVDNKSHHTRENTLMLDGIIQTWFSKNMLKYIDPFWSIFTNLESYKHKQLHIWLEAFSIRWKGTSFCHDFSTTSSEKSGSF